MATRAVPSLSWLLERGPILAISATFTAEPLEETLAFWMRELRLDHQVRFAPYNQVFQQLLDPASLLASNRNGLNVVLVRPEDWGRESNLPENSDRLIECVRRAAESFSSPLLLCVTPGSARNADEQRIHAGLEDLSGVYLLAAEEVDRWYPVAERHDPQAEHLGHVPYTPEYFTALGTAIARKLHALLAAPYKAIALDCDDTLWGGVCGEDGPEGVIVDAPRRALQEFMLAQQDSGMLLCLCTKNNEEDVIRTFQTRREMPLRLEHFAARRINWEAKSANLAELAAQLDLDLNSFVFLDNSRQEIGEVQADRPEVLALLLPEETETIPEFLRHVWAFDHLKITEEDRRRTALYAQQEGRAKLERQASSLEEFIAALGLEVRIESLSQAQIPRVAQLTQRTNQMNFTTIRRTEQQIQSLISSGRAECLTVDVSDRFGDYGLTGVIIFEPNHSVLRIDTFLLSCRVLGRGVEHRVMAKLGEISKARGVNRIDAPFFATERNRPALQFLESVFPTFRSEREHGLMFEIPAEYASALTFKPGKGSPKKAAEFVAHPSAERSKENRTNGVDIGRIAAQLRTVGRIRAEMRAGRPRLERTPESAAPATDLERQIAAIWSELLAVPEIGVDDNFFDLGGHSLLAVEMLSRVNRTLGIDLSLEVMYASAFTVAELARTIELKQIERESPEEYAALLREIAAMSDEDVRKLLSEGEGSAG